jgi:hypothetical protein
MPTLVPGWWFKMRVQVSGFGVEGSRFRFKGLGFRVCKVQALDFMIGVRGLEFEMEGLGLRV